MAMFSRGEVNKYKTHPTFGYPTLKPYPWVVRQTTYFVIIHPPANYALHPSFLTEEGIIRKKPNNLLLFHANIVCNTLIIYTM
jgi:hypothetical protein